MKNQTPAERLRTARIQAGFESAAEAALRIGVKSVTYTAHENGGREYDRASCVLYADKFRVSPGWLMFGEESGAGRSAAETRIPQVDFSPTGKMSCARLLSDFEEITMDTIREFAIDWWEIPKPFIERHLGVNAGTVFITACPTLAPQMFLDVSFGPKDTLFVTTDRGGFQMAAFYLVATSFLPEVHHVRVTGRNEKGQIVGEVTPLVRGAEAYVSPIDDIRIIGLVKSRCQTVGNS